MDTAIWAQRAVLQVMLAQFNGSGDRALNQLAVIRVNSVQERLECSAEGAGRQAMDSFELGRPGDGVGPQVPFPGAHLARGDGYFEPFACQPLTLEQARVLQSH